jgi:hypothetical protein
MGELKYVSGGAGILIPNKLISKLFNMKCYNTSYSDVNLGMNIRDRNLEIKDSKLFNPSNPYREDKVDQLENEINSNITQHYIVSANMLEFDSLVKL